MEFNSKCGKYKILVDDQDYQRVLDFAPNGWEVKYTTGSNNPYAITRKTITDSEGKRVRKQYYLHRVVMNVLDDSTFHVDHKFTNTLDNRKSELRLVTRSQNMRNRTVKKNSASKYLGVAVCNYKQTNPYRVVINSDLIKTHIGYFPDEESAGFAYNVAAEIIHGEYANLNKVNLEAIASPMEIRELVLSKIRL